MADVARWETKFLVFEYFVSPSGKTRLWSVLSKVGNDLGEIRWHGPWRKYVFRTVHSYALFDVNCLRDIADFCEGRTEEHKEK